MAKVLLIEDRPTVLLESLEVREAVMKEITVIKSLTKAREIDPMVYELIYLDGNIIEGSTEELLIKFLPHKEKVFPCSGDDFFLDKAQALGYEVTTKDSGSETQLIQKIVEISKQ